MIRSLKALDRTEKFLEENAKHYKQDISYIKEDLELLNNIKSHIIEVDNEPENGDDYYYIVLEKTAEVRELLNKLTNKTETNSNSNIIKCPFCGKSHFTQDYGTITTINSVPIYKDGEIIWNNPNTITYHCTCLECGKTFTHK